MSEQNYHVTWEIDIVAISHEDAARKCQRYMDARDTGWQFDVVEMDKELQHPIGESISIDMGEIMDNEWLAENGPQD